MSFVHLLQQHDYIFYGLTLFIGLAFGSFLNVVIYRLPAMLEKEWRSQCHEFLELEAATGSDNKLTLAIPASTCPSCGHKIRIWENIPVLSYLLLRGKCSSCKAKISIQYPLVEVVTAILSLMIASHFGVSWQTPLALIFTWVLITLTMIDFHKQLLPDNLTLPLLWLGILANLFGFFTDLSTSVIGAMAGYLSLWLIYHLFKFLTGKEGMGFGDFKLLAALGAWMGWQMLPLIIILSSFVGAVIGISMIVLTRHDRSIPIPFGPYLAIAGWIALLWGDSLSKAWLGLY